LRGVEPDVDLLGQQPIQQLSRAGQVPEGEVGEHQPAAHLRHQRGRVGVLGQQFLPRH